MAYSSTLLTNKVGIVTGAGSSFGIGRSLVMSLALAGAKAVYATDLTLVNIPSLQQEVKDAGSSCQVHGAILDVTSEDQTVSVLKEIIATYGRLDFFFANAGFGNYKCGIGRPSSRVHHVNWNIGHWRIQMPSTTILPSTSCKDLSSWLLNMVAMPCATLLTKSPVPPALLLSQALWLEFLEPFQTFHTVRPSPDISGHQY